MRSIKHIIIFAILATLLLPLGYTPWTVYPWHFGKTVIFQIIIDILVVLAGIIWTRSNADKWRPDHLDGLMLLFALSMTVSALAGTDIIHSWWGDMQRAGGVFSWLQFTAFYFLVRIFFTQAEDWGRVRVAVYIAAVLSSLLAIIGPHIDSLHNIIVPNERLSGLIGNPIFLASYLILPAFWSAADGWREESGKKYLYWGVSLLCLATIFLTQTRGALLAAIAALPVMAIIYFFISRNRKARIWISVLAVFMLLSAGTGYFIFQNKSAQIAYPRVARLFSISLQDTTTSTRLMAWRIAWNGWKERPALGWGPENFINTFDKYYDPGFLKYSFAETVWERPHNYFLEIMNNNGLGGAAAYLAIFLWVLRKLFLAAKGAPESKKQIFFIILSGGWTAYFIQGLFAFETSNSLQLWFLFSAFAVYAAGAEFFQKINIPFIKIRTLGYGLIILSLLAVSYNLRIFRGGAASAAAIDAGQMGSAYQWQKAAVEVLKGDSFQKWDQAVLLIKDLNDLDSRGLVDSDLLKATLPALPQIIEARIEKDPDSAQLRFWLAQYYALAGEYVDNTYYRQADDLLAAAAQISPGNQKIVLVRAKNELLQDHTDEAIKILRELINRNPDYPEPHWFLGLALANQEKIDEAIKELELGASHSAGTRQNMLFLIDIYAKQKEYAKIIEYYNKLIQLDQNNYQYYSGLAATYAALGKESEVLYNLNKAVELNPALRDEARKYLRDNKIDEKKLGF